MKNILLVNFFTTIRLIGIFILVPIYYEYGALIAGLFLIFIYSTDKIDGSLAKILNSRTFFGSIYDSVCDKILNIVSFILLLNITYFAFIPLLFEILIFSLNLIRLKFGQNIKAEEIGRVKMVVLAITVILTFLLSGNFTTAYDYLLLYLPLLLLDLFTFVNYLRLFINEDKKLNKKIFKTRKNFKSKLFDPKFYEENQNISYADAIRK